MTTKGDEMSKDLLVLADQYAAATATFARALALKDGADSMSPIAREAGDKRAALAEAIAALDTAQQEPVNAMLVEALERMVESVTGVDQVSAVNEARAALTAAKQAQPEPYGYHSPKTGKVYASTEAASMAMAGEVKTVYLAQPEPRPTEDALWDETLKDRDAYHQFADDLAAQIAAITGVDIGEHSSVNNPWQEAMLAADDFIATQLKTMLLQQTQPSQADAQDAARYRWLRSTTNWASNSSNERIDVRNCPELWDAAIDAAINAKEQPNG